MERPREVRQALRTIDSYIEHLEADLEMERAARKRAELKVKAAQASHSPRPSPPPPPGSREHALTTLGLSGQPTEQEIRQAYRNKARVFHPDAAGGSAAQFRSITQALDLLLPNPS